MGVSEQHDPGTEATRPANVDANGEVIEPDDEPDTTDEPEQDDEPDGDEAEATAEHERRQELAAERQAEEQSLEQQQREQDARAKKLNQLAAHVAKRYTDILGDDLDGFVGCAMCAPWFPGIRLPVMPDPETVAQIKVAIGEDPDPPLHEDNYSRQCSTCGGYGTVRTGSFVTGQKAATCLDCKGRGWIAVGSERDSNGQVVVPDVAQQSAPELIAAAPAPLVTDTPRTPAEEELRAMGAIVVWPPKPPDMSTL